MQDYSVKARQCSSICYLVIAVVFATIKMLSAFGVLSFLGNVGNAILSAVVQIGLLFCVAVFMFGGLFKASPRQTMTFYGFKKISLKGILISVVLGVIVYILNVYGSSIIQTILVGTGYKYSTSSIPENYTIWMLLLPRGWGLS